MLRPAAVEPVRTFTATTPPSGAERRVREAAGRRGRAVVCCPYEFQVSDAGKVDRSR